MSALILLRLKGFAKPETLGADADALVAQGLAEAGKLGLRLTPAGRAAADAAWGAERAATDPAAIEAVHAGFVALNSGFKALVTAWQLRDGAPNDHTDAAYDADIVAQLTRIDAALDPVLADASALAPRLARYRPAFAAALGQLMAGEARWMAAPVIDSYHTLWFELHEELIRLTGRSRAAEAAAGHAA
jgi:pyruvate, orthophosphate dikinase